MENNENTIQEIQPIEAVKDLITLENRSESYLAHIKKANLLTPALTETVIKLMPELNHIYKTQTIWRTETEIRCSVLNDMNFPDNASKYHQAKLEQLVFSDQLLHLSFEFRKLQQDLNTLEADIEEIQDALTDLSLKSFQIKRKEAELEKKFIEREEIAYKIQHMQVEAQERIRELEVWSRIKDEVNDGSFDIDKKDTNQLISMARRYVVEAFNAVHNNKNSDICSYNNITAQFYTLVRNCIEQGLFLDMMSIFGDPNTIPIAAWVYSYFSIPTPPVNPVV